MSPPHHPDAPRAMIRWLLNLLSTLSLLLLAATLLLWVRSHFAVDHVWLVHRDGGAEFLRGDRGRLTVRHVIPNVRGVPLPQRLSHWSCRPHSQLPPARSRLHWEWAFLTYEGTPGATPQEVAAAAAVLRQVEAAKSAPPPPRPPPPPTPPADSTDPAAQRAYFLRLMAQRAAPDPRQALRYRETAAREVLEGTSYHEWTFPAWLAALATAILPTATFLPPAWRRHRRRQRGQCPRCGYDWRATPGRCPECGAGASVITSR